MAEIDDVWRIRYTTSHPRDMDDDLIAAHGDIEKLMPFLHLPVQSGSDAMLAAMNRQHSAEDYLRLIERLRAARPDIAFSSDFIVGFPGESDADFEATMALVRDVGFAQCFSFKYSARPGTPAAAAKKQIAEQGQERTAGRVAETASVATGRRPTRTRSARSCRCCSKSPAATKARSSAARPICSRFMPKARSI